MAAAAGVYKKVATKRESTYGTLAGAAGARYLRRVEFTADLNKDTYKSNELRPDMQVSDFRHGVRRVPVALKGELSPGAYSDELSQLLRKDFAAVSAITGASVTIAAGSIVGGIQQYTVTRATGSYLSDGVKIGDIMRLSVGTLNANNISKNLWILALTATVATVITLNGSVMTAEGPIASTTITVTGKKSYMPATGHTNISYTSEAWYADVAQSEVFTGVKYNKADIQLPPTGIAQINLSGSGKDMGSTGTSQYFTTPTALTTTAVVAAVNGVLTIGGIPQATVTGMSVSINSPQSGDPVVGSNTVPTQFQGVMEVTGQITVQFVDTTARDLFVNETESTLMVAMTSDNTAAADFVTFVMSRIKVGGASKNDGQGSIVQTLPFQALINNAGGASTANEQSSIVVQDSQAA
jgi:hypothetical protein